MKKRVKVKGIKKSSKRTAKAAQSSAPTESELPNLVAAMMKLVERLESVERKMDSGLGRVSNFPSEIRNAVQNLQRPASSFQMQVPKHPDLRPAQPQPQFRSQSPAQSHGPAHPDVRRDRPMYQAVCADCRKNCEIPFKPSAERAVYCKACFAIRKGGGFPPQGNRGPLTSPQNAGAQAAAVMPASAAPAKGAKQKPARQDSAKAKKRK